MAIILIKELVTLANFPKGHRDRLRYKTLKNVLPGQDPVSIHKRLNGLVACEKNVFSHKDAYVNSGRVFLDLKRDRYYKTADGKTHRVMCSISDRGTGLYIGIW